MVQLSSPKKKKLEKRQKDTTIDLLNAIHDKQNNVQNKKKKKKWKMR